MKQMLNQKIEKTKKENLSLMKLWFHFLIITLIIIELFGQFAEITHFHPIKNIEVFFYISSKKD